ncbi:hypothetical protein Nepgr_028965 [Nepenthes gracilis]|uniref:Uncharacterized protein n=1 Tax=Nepenthes gracilis TaxID=150966 RepID=A0AAD3TEK4_NEPGR|nr:hypothetical protein Nepgr_028965 [Nepenthes gracilis]
MFSCTPPGLAHIVDKGLVMNVKDFVNPFVVLQDSEDLVEQKLQCGPRESMALSTNDGIPTKTGSVPVSKFPVEPTCHVPVGGCHELAREVLGHHLLQEAQSSSHKGFAGLNGRECKKINSTVGLDITPESINRITIKYFLADPVLVEPTSVSPRGPPDGDQLGGVQVATGKGLLPLGSNDLYLDNCPMNESSMSEEAKADEADPMFHALQLLLESELDRRGIEVDSPQGLSELDGTWQYVKSRRRQKSKSKNIRIPHT